MVSVGKPNNDTYLCHTWDSVAKKWVQDHVTTVKEEIDISGVAATVVTCNVTKMVEIALFKGPPRPEPTTAAPSTVAPSTVAATTVAAANGSVATTAAAPSNNTSNVTASTAAPVVDVNATTAASTVPVTTAAATTTTLAPENIPQLVSFTIAYPKANCTAKLNASTNGTFQANIRSQIASAAGVQASALQKFNLTCASINVEFQLVKDPSSGSVADMAKKIEDKVKAGTMQVTIDGQTATADTSSFTAVKDPSYPTPAPVVPKPKDDDDDLSAGAIVGIVIAVIALVVIVIVVVYVCCVKKNTRKQGAVRPTAQDQVEMTGNSNKAYTDYP